MIQKLLSSLLLLLLLTLPIQATFASEDISTTGATTTKYIFAGDTLVATIEGSGSTTNATTTNVVHTDHLGGTHAVSSATGTVVQALDYYPYGSIRINSQQAPVAEL